MDTLNSFSINEQLAERMREENGIDCFVSDEGLTAVYALRFDISGMKDFDRLEAEITCGEEAETVVLDDFYSESLNYRAGRKVFPGKAKEDVILKIFLYTKNGRCYLVGDSTDRIYNKEESTGTGE